MYLLFLINVKSLQSRIEELEEEVEAERQARAKVTYRLKIIF